MHFTGNKSLPLILLLLMHKNVKLTWRLNNYCNSSPWRNSLIKLTHYDETKKGVHDAQLVRAKENIKMSHCVFIDDFPTLYRLPKFHKILYKTHFIANSSSFTTTEWSIILTSCLTAIKTML